MGTPSQLSRNTEMLDVKVPAELWTELRTEGLIREDAPTFGRV
jgi:hypothetical protein